MSITRMDGQLQIKSAEDPIEGGEGQVVISMIMLLATSKDITRLVGGVVHPYFVSCSISPT